MQAEKSQVRVPPYVSYKTLKTFIEDLKTHGTPTRIDRSIWGSRFSGSVGGQLMSALRFLNLIDSNDAPEEKLKALVEAHGTEAWASKLQPVIQASYKPIMGLKLDQITPAQLAEEFKKAYKAQDAVIQKSITFFLHAVQDAGIPLSKRVLKTTRRSISRPRPVITKKKNNNDDNEDEQEHERHRQNGNPDKHKMQVLLDILDPEAMDDQGTGSGVDADSVFEAIKEQRNVEPSDVYDHTLAKPGTTATTRSRKKQNPGEGFFASQSALPGPVKLSRNKTSDTACNGVGGARPHSSTRPNAVGRRF